VSVTPENGDPHPDISTAVRWTLLLACAQVLFGMVPLVATDLSRRASWSYLAGMHLLASDAVLGYGGHRAVADPPLGPLLLLLPGAVYAAGASLIDARRRGAIVMVAAVATVQTISVLIRAAMTAVGIDVEPPGFWAEPGGWIVAPLFVAAANGWTIWQLVRARRALMAANRGIPAPASLRHIWGRAFRSTMATGAVYLLIGLWTALSLLLGSTWGLDTDPVLTLFFGGEFTPWARLLPNVIYLAPLAYLVPGMIYVVCAAFVGRGQLWAMWTCLGLALVQWVLNLVACCCQAMFVFQMGRRLNGQGSVAVLLVLLVLLSMTARRVHRAIRTGGGFLDPRGHGFQPIVAQSSG
jgi:hypothetical protein